ncbi:GNAT family N-acetyltransferase [Sphingomonas morindae]|uniref:GNAT family N-acetyltransferase n=1 Tax=Sphingomonas morindae TaxID=1541170 RepID=A0ABY4X5M7_9SPHN|nr:GNAT family N-acetyltransferase [Sphingomonas morindae]USI72203.1 GNAT family N-acetyltransferase [Sphingomonas morindae]
METPPRVATEADITALAALKVRTFRETFLEDFAIPYPPRDLAAFERRYYAPARIAAELDDPARLTLVSETADGLIGYAQIGPCRLPHEEARPEQGELYQLYVARPGQGRGFGRLLLAAALAALESRFPGPHWLGVWSGNHRAQAVYRARGFEPVGSYAFAVWDWTDHELIFRRPG